jgi:hypothetical protein
MTVPPAAPAPEPPGETDPARSACVLIGVNAFEHLERLDAVRHNLARLAEVLRDPGIGGFTDPRRVEVVANPESALDITDAIDRAGRLAEDTLVVYYSGHGMIGRDDGLCLTLPSSRKLRPESWVDARDVRAAVDRSHALRSVVVLDCCFSGRYFRGSPMSADAVGTAVQSLAEGTGSYVLTSAPHNRASHAPDPEDCSAFTGALVRVLREGVPAGPQMLTLRMISDRVKEAMKELPEAEQPQSHDDNDLGDLRLVRNAALGPVPTPVPPAPPRRRWPAALLGAVAGAALAWGGPALWPYVHDTQAAGACSARAALLGYSDKLDKAPLSEGHLSGLSGLSFPPDGDGRTVYSVSDNDAGLLFRIDIGSPGHLDPRIDEDGDRTLRGTDGKPLAPAWLDDEALALEKDTGTGRKGAGTVLIASENGPAIRRFDLRTARQTGPALPVPAGLRVAPAGQALAGRSFESLTVSPDGSHLYAGLEAPLAQDGDWHGRGLIRIQRWSGRPGGAYTPDIQYVFLSDEGLDLTELAAVDGTHLLALERQYSAGVGNAIRVRELDLAQGQDVSRTQKLFNEPTDLETPSRLLFDLADCPAGRPGAVPQKEPQPNPLLENVEGMALGPTLTGGPYRGRRLLLMVSDDNDSAGQTTRMYEMAVKVP